MTFSVMVTDHPWSIGLIVLLIIGAVVEIWRRRPLLPPDVTDPVAVVRTPSGWWIEGPHNTVYGQEWIKGGVPRPFLSRRRAYAALRRYYQQDPFD
jgi:hypothetical protein